MKTNSKTTVKVLKRNITKKLDGIRIHHIARSIGFLKRVPKKISPKNLMIGFFMMTFKKSNSFMSWATQVSLLFGNTVSKQAIWNKMTQKHVHFLRTLLSYIFAMSMKSEQKAIAGSSSKSTLFDGFKRVLLHDSTCLKLPDYLACYFPGNYSKGKIKAVAKLQTIYDAKSSQYANISLGSFSQNDQSASGSIFEYASRGDLVIRDLGYFVLKVFQRCLNEGIYFLSRLMYGIMVIDKQTNQPIELVKLLHNKQNIDMEVYIGKEKRLPIRLVGIKLPEQVVAERRRKAKTDRDKRRNPSKAYLQLLEWALFITNVNKQIWTVKQVVLAYRLRWRIEIIFKSWKSYFRLTQMLDKNQITKTTVEIFIYYLLIFIALFQVKLYNYLLYKLHHLKGVYISLLKFSKYISENLIWILNSLEFDLDKVERNIIYYCRYDKRSDRPNYFELIYQLS